MKLNYYNIFNKKNTYNMYSIDTIYKITVNEITVNKITVNKITGGNYMLCNKYGGGDDMSSESLVG